MLKTMTHGVLVSHERSIVLMAATYSASTFWKPVTRAIRSLILSLVIVLHTSSGSFVAIHVSLVWSLTR